MPPLGSLDLDRLVNFVYWRIVDGADGREIEKFRARLWQPPRGVVADERSAWAPAQENNAFAAARKALLG